MASAFGKSVRMVGIRFGLGAMAALVGMALSGGARAAEADAKALFKAMSDYMAAQKAISFAVDTKLGLASSGTVVLNRPDKIHVARSGGFANINVVFDGKTLTLLSKDDNVYGQIEVPGTIDHLVDELRDKYHRPVPAADLLLSDIYDQLMPMVVDVKDLGSGVIHGVECDHLAFRSSEVDWQIWIAQGDRPYPCRYVITSPKVTGSPQYSIDVRDWKTGSEVVPDDFGFKIPSGAKKVETSDLPDIDELPSIFAVGGTK